MYLHHHIGSCSTSPEDLISLTPVFSPPVSSHSHHKNDHNQRNTNNENNNKINNNNNERFYTRETGRVVQPARISRWNHV